MFAVIFEVTQKPGQQDEYLRRAGQLRPILEQIDGFILNDRYASLGRPNWLVSLSLWRDEKAVVRWRTVAMHHETQAKGREEILADYHLRVGEITTDSGLPAGEALREQRFDETETGAAKSIVLTAQTLAGLPERPDTPELAAKLGLAATAAAGLVDWDVFRHLQRGNEYLLLSSWRDMTAADAFIAAQAGSGARQRQVRVIRDYGMFDRREAPQYYPPVARPAAP